MQRTLVLVKPDGVQRGLIGEVISRLEDRGLKIVGLKLLQLSDDSARSPLRRTRRQTVLSGTGRLHHFRAAGGHGR